MLRIIWETLRCVINEIREGKKLGEVVETMSYTVERGSYTKESKMDKGEWMEKEVYKDIKGLVRGLTRVKVNMLIPTKYGSTQIDVMMISKEGVKVIECKNYGGEGREVRLRGLVGEKDWEVEYPNGKVYKIYNTIMQNAGHIKNVKRVLREGGYKKDVEIMSYVVFSDNVKIPRNLKSVREREGIKVRVCNRNEFRYILGYERSEVVCSKEDILKIEEISNKYIRASKREERRHKDYVNKVSRGDK